jgi:cobalt-zinc-cadmium efflux system outer membrane protein
MFFKILLTFFFLGVAVCRGGPNSEINEPTGVLTLRQALALALTGSPELAMFDYDIRIAEARILQARLLPNPELDLTSENVAGSGAFSGTDAAEQTLQLGQHLELAGKRRKRVREARLGRELAGFDYEVKKREVFLDVHQAFVEVLAGQRGIAVNREIVELTESVLPDIRRRMEAGKTSSIELTRSNVAIATARIGLEQARRDTLAARHRLAGQWGSTKPRFSSAVGNLEDSPPLASLDVLTARLAENPRVARFDTEVAQRDATLARERAAAVPDVTIRGGVRQFSGPDNSAFLVGASLPIPLFNRNQGNIRAAREQIGRTESERHFVEATISAELAEAYYAAEAAREQIQLFREIVMPQSDEALKMTSEGYRAGRFSYLEFLDVQRSLVTARQQYVAALLTHQQAIAKIESLTSGPLHRGHERSNR